MSSYEEKGHFVGSAATGIGYNIVPPPMICHSEKGWYGQHDYPSRYVHVVVTNSGLPVTNSKLPGFLVGKVLQISGGAVRAEIQKCPGGWMKTEFTSWTSTESYKEVDAKRIERQTMVRQSEAWVVVGVRLPQSQPPKPNVRVINGKIPGFLLADKVTIRPPFLQRMDFYPLSNGTWECICELDASPAEFDDDACVIPQAVPRAVP
jgi:hypothetical protein